MRNRVVAVFDFLLGLVELGIAYAIYEVFNSLNISYLTSPNAFGNSALASQAAGGFLTGLALLAVFVGIHGIKRIIENIVIFFKVAAAATRSMAAATQDEQ